MKSYSIFFIQVVGKYVMTDDYLCVNLKVLLKVLQ